MGIDIEGKPQRKKEESVHSFIHENHKIWSVWRESKSFGQPSGTFLPKSNLGFVQVKLNSIFNLLSSEHLNIVALFPSFSFSSSDTVCMRICQQILIFSHIQGDKVDKLNLIKSKLNPIYWGGNKPWILLVDHCYWNLPLHDDISKSKTLVTFQYLFEFAKGERELEKSFAFLHQMQKWFEQAVFCKKIELIHLKTQNNKLTLRIGC